LLAWDRGAAAGDARDCACGIARSRSVLSVDVQGQILRDFCDRYGQVFLIMDLFLEFFKPAGIRFFRDPYHYKIPLNAFW
jgi:hypothetical protein